MVSGEQALIRRIAQRFGTVVPAGAMQVLESIGDDTAVLQAGGQTLLVTVDMLVEGVHFRLDWTAPHALGWKCLAVNLSDIASMGGTPVGALLSLALPAERVGEWLDAFVEGFAECGRTYGCALLGGDTNRSPLMVIDGMVLGTVAGAPVLRRGAQVGDWLLVTGTLGGSRAGLKVLESAIPAAERALWQDALEAHWRPLPRLTEGALARQAGVHAMMDLSDGLASDLPKLAEASAVGAVIWESALPIHPSARRWAEAHGENPALFALAGGEDYELLMSAPPKVARTLLERIPAETGTPLTAIGEVIEQRGIWLERSSGAREPLRVQGWDHFG